MLDKYENYLRTERRYSSHTCISYLKDVKSFLEFCEEQFETTNPKQITFSFCRSWIAALVMQGQTARSVNRKRSAINNYYKFLIREEEVTSNPMDGISAPKFEKRLPDHLRINEVDELLLHLPEPIDFASARDRMIVELLYHTGMRRAELISLKLQDVDLHAKRLKVFGKRQKERYVPLTKSIHESLKNYLIYRNALEEVQDPAYLLLTDKGKLMYPKFVYNTVKRYISLVSSRMKRSPHILRHTFATHLLDKGADINAIKELLGHANLSATQVYTHTSIEKIKKIYSQTHPKA